MWKTRVEFHVSILYCLFISFCGLSGTPIIIILVRKSVPADEEQWYILNRNAKFICVWSVKLQTRQIHKRTYMSSPEKAREAYIS